MAKGTPSPFGKKAAYIAKNASPVKNVKMIPTIKKPAIKPMAKKGK